MNMEELIWKCQASMLKEEEEDMVAVIDKMRERSKDYDKLFSGQNTSNKRSKLGRSDICHKTSVEVH